MNIHSCQGILGAIVLLLAAGPALSHVSPETPPQGEPAVLLQVASAGAPAATVTPAAAGVKVESAWVRSSVPGQSGTGGFMTLTASKTTRLVGLTSPVSGNAEVHEMKMEGDVMKMRPLAGLDLPAGQPVRLRPGGLHLMLTELKQPLQPGSTVPVTLLFKDANGVESRMALQLPVRANPPAGAAATPAHGTTEGHKH